MNHCQTRQLRNSYVTYSMPPFAPTIFARGGRQHQQPHSNSYLIVQLYIIPMQYSLICELFETATYAAFTGQAVTYYGLGPEEEKSRHP